jgi:predicted RNA-binding protein with TRAM domain
MRGFGGRREGGFNRGRGGGGFGSRGGFGRGDGFRERSSEFDKPKPVKVGEERVVKITDVGAKGDGITKIDDFIIFVAGAHKGEECKIRIKEVARRFAIAEKIGAADENASEESDAPEDQDSDMEESVEEKEDEGSELEDVAAEEEAEDEGVSKEEE